MSTSTRSDLELVAASQRGQLDAFAGIVGRYRSLVSATAYSATGDPAMTEDVAQETFLVAWSRIDTVREPAKLGGWLCGIARNLGLGSLRRAGREVATSESEIANLEQDVQASALDAALSQESETLVWDAIQDIPDLYRVPILMHYREDCSIPEIAEGLGLTRATVQQRLSRGRSHIRKSMTDLVERTLSQHKPAKGFVAGVVGMITTGAAPLGAQANPPATELEAPTAAAIGSAGAMSMMTKILIGLTLAGGMTFAAITFASDTNRVDQTAAGSASAPVPPNSPSSISEGSPGRNTEATAEAKAQAADPTMASFGGLEENVVSFQAKVDGVLVDPTEIPEELAMCLIDGVEESATVKTIFSIAADGDNTAVSNIEVVGPHPYGESLSSVRDCLHRELPRLKLAVGKHSFSPEITVKAEEPQPSAEMASMVARFGDRTRGAPDAPITIVQFSSFDCRFSGKILGAMDQLFEEYPGKLHVIVKQGKPELGSLAAHAAIAASAQGEYWPMHNLLFQNQQAHAREDLLGYARNLGLDLVRFEIDLDSDETDQQVQADLAEASALGVVATPTLVINGVRVRGARPIEMYQEHIDSLLAE